MYRRAILYALASAALFGLSTPAAKVLLGTIHPAILAGLLYSGAGIGVGVLRRVRPRVFGVPNAPQVPLQRTDVLWLAAAIAAGGVVGPLLLMFGLGRTDAATASLLMALEGAATAIMRNAVRLSGAWNFTVAMPVASVTAPGTHTALATNRERTVPRERAYPVHLLLRPEFGLYGGRNPRRLQYPNA